MTTPLRDFYESRRYPAMSHPSSDPAVTAVAALLGGLETTPPSRARILEIGCSSGLNLIPLARRWPDAEFLGIDVSEPDIALARELAGLAGAGNLRFEAADLRHFDPGFAPFDFIIAHGFLSWVPDEVKSALFSFCKQHLAPNGIATISFNLEAGWRQRMPVIEKTRAILAAGAEDPIHALGILRTVTPAESAEIPIIDDMIAKGPDILAFDDLGPVNHPWPLEHFLKTAASHGLRWLGESDPSQNLPPGLTHTQVEDLRSRHADPLSLQLAADTLARRTFRSATLCHSEASLVPGVQWTRLLEISFRAGVPPASHPDARFHAALQSVAPRCLPVSEIASFPQDLPDQDIARALHRGILAGWALPRIEPLRFDPSIPDQPSFGRWRGECLKRSLPVVDIWHRPCTFPPGQRPLLALLDGTRSRDELLATARELCPGLECLAWLGHLAERGLFLDS